LKRMVSVKALVEMLKAIGKVVLLISAAVLVFAWQRDTLLMSQHTHLFGGLSRIGDVFLLLLIVFLLVLAGMAIIDVIWEQYQHTQQ
ncbi:flagellar biosynthesis protein FlhB, partial [bacterium LRH843]|nr:flagellar biosynthesis protein FlhB [bacterium LRH843]